MKRVLISAAIVILISGLLSSYPSSYNTTGSTMGTQMQEQPATGITKAANKPGVYDYKPAPTPAPTQQAGKPDTKKLDDIIVTARRIPELISLVPRSIEVITESQIKAYGTEKLADLIESIAGLTVIRYGGYEGVNSVLFRGSPSNHTLVLQDGVPVNDMLTGTVDLTMIDMSDVDRVEVVKGGMSSIYGSDASAGVINIITGSKDKKILNAEASYGSFDTQRYILSSDYNIFKVDYSLAGADEESPGYAPNSDFIKRTADLKLSFDGDAVTSKLYGHYLKREMGVPYNDNGPSLNARQSDENYSLNVDEDIKIPVVNMKVLGFMRSGDLYFRNPDIFIDARQQKREYQSSVIFTYDQQGAISAMEGYENNYSNVISSDFGNKSISNQASISNVSLKLFNDALVANAGFRADFNSSYGNSTGENISAKYKFQDGAELYASVEKSFAFPTFGDTFWPNDGFEKGNPNLRPEITTSYEAGIKKKGDVISEEVSCFMSDIRDLISWSADQGTGLYMPFNLNNAEISGAEAKVDLAITDSVSAYARYTYLTAKDKATNADLPNRPRNEVNAGTVVKLPAGFGFSATGQYVDNRPALDGATLLHPYYLVNFRLTQKFSENFEIFGDLSNALDNTTYESVNNSYKMPGRSITVGIKAGI
jgi:vitamin B12 transporter